MCVHNENAHENSKRKGNISASEFVGTIAMIDIYSSTLRMLLLAFSRESKRKKGIKRGKEIESLRRDNGLLSYTVVFECTGFACFEH